MACNFVKRSLFEIAGASSNSIEQSFASANTLGKGVVLTQLDEGSQLVAVGYR